MSTIKFECSLRIEPVTLDFGNGEVLSCTVREMEGDVLEDYLEGAKDSVVTTESEEQDVQKNLRYTGMHARFVALVQRCLYGPDDQLVAVERIKKLPPRVKLGLYKIAQKVNDLAKADDKEPSPN